MIKDGISWSGRLQKYMLNHFVVPVSRVVDQTLLKKFLDVEDLDEQKKLFKQLPLEAIKAIMRYSASCV